MKVGQLFGREGLDARDVHSQARTALTFEARIDAGPLVGRHVGDAAERLVVNRPHADAVVLDVVDDVVDVAVGVAGAARELAPERNVGAVKQSLATSVLGDFRRPAKVHAAGGFQLLQVNHRDGIVTRVGDIRSGTVRRTFDALRTSLCGNEGNDEFGGLAQMVGNDPLPFLGTGCPEHGNELVQVDHGHAVGTAAGNKRVFTVGRDAHGGRVGEAQVVLIEQHLINRAVPPEDAEAVGDGPSVVDARHGHQVLGAQQGDDGEVAARIPRHPLQEVRRLHHETVLYGRLLGVNYGDF